MNLSASALSVLGDAREERGLSRRPLWLVDADAPAPDPDYADAYADAPAYADGDADAYADAPAYADGDADADGDDASTYADADGDADGDDASTYDPQHRSPKMKDGLYAVSVSQFGRVVLRIGWFRRDPTDPDEYECVWVTPYRGEYRTKLAEVWAEGPKHGGASAWTWSPQVPSMAHRIHFQPLARLDPKLWGELCPRPEGWES